MKKCGYNSSDVSSLASSKTCLGLLICFLCVDLATTVVADKQTMLIGGLFEHEYRGQELAFKYAIRKINERKDILPNISLQYDIQSTPAQDSFHASKKVCKQMKQGVAAIFGPMSSLSASHVQSVCDAMEIPHVETRWDYSEDKDSFSINLYPFYKSLSRSFIDLVRRWKWTSFTILYEENSGLIKLQELLKAPSDEKFDITVRRLEAVDGDYRPILKDIKKKGESHIVIDCHVSKVHKILKEAQSINMMSHYYHYLLTTLDLGLVDLEDFKYGGTNITAFRLVDPDNPQVTDVTSDWVMDEMKTGASPLENEQGIRTETALMYDAVQLFAKALDQLTKAQHITTTPLSCSKSRTWANGFSVLNYMKTSTLDGITGKVEFDDLGIRSTFTLDIVELTTDGLEKIGYWNIHKGVNITKDFSRVYEQLTDSLKNKTLVVTTIMEDPYVMWARDPSDPSFGELKGNERFEGYCVDLLKEIAVILEFNYTIKLVDDGKYGAPVGDNGEWNGMVKELIDKKADLAVASLTISWVREQVIDFTKPFMNLGISILFKKPEKKSPSLFSFHAPLSAEIWVYMVAAYLVVSFMLFVLARFSPYEWYNPHPCNPDSDVVENQFTLLNSLWFTIGSLMQQGSEVAPRALSTRLISGTWWFFTLIMISSYTANLAAFLTVERMTSPIENADDLSKQTEIRYGTIWGGSTMTFFKTSKIPTYERMWNFMNNAKPTVFVNTTKEGIIRVKKGSYAYLLESTMNEYIVQRNCELMQVGGLLDSKGYGIGTPRDSPYRDLISNAILKLQEEQMLQMLYNKWWKEKGGAGRCDAEKDAKKDANELGVENVGGVFVVLLGGLILSIFVAIFEFIWKARKTAEEEKDWVDTLPKQSLCSQMGEELRFAVRCLGPSEKPAKKKIMYEPTAVIDNGVKLVPLSSMMTSQRYNTSVPPMDHRMT